ncbi:uncharacterized protein LOC135682606 [Rhopilema esculentum]|uniref:uncharacterized protein LOC135682606 n=1 Tax=Rhopilema esculentum TaxID=499914 RepID=UPI0031CDE0D2
MMTELDVTMSAENQEKGFEMLPPSQKMSPEREDTALNQSSAYQEEAEIRNANDKGIHRDVCYSYADDECQSLNQVLQESLPEIKLSFEKWGETFKDCENVENLYPTRLDEIIKDAQSLEQQLNLQKEALKDRLRMLTQTLASVQSDIK